jgi:hypothetical protein
MKAATPKPISGMDLDRRMREILMAATRETVLSSVSALVELGFPGPLSFTLVSDIIIARDQHGS